MMDEEYLTDSRFAARELCIYRQALVRFNTARKKISQCLAHNQELLLTVEWKNGSVVFIDQTKLPGKLAYVKCKDYKEVADVIRKLVVRGAPAIGVSASFWSCPCGSAEQCQDSA